MKIQIILLFLIGTLGAQAQEKKVEKLISISLPQGVEKPTKEQLASFLGTRKNSSFEAQGFSGSIYKFGNVLLKINADSGAIERNRLESSKISFDNLSAKIPDIKYSSEIKMINGNKVWITNTEKYDLLDYRVMSINRDYNKILVATIEYKKVDEAKAKMLLNHFLNNLKFK